jgi:hypothetical protein
MSRSAAGPTQPYYWPMCSFRSSMRAAASRGGRWPIPAPAIFAPGPHAPQTTPYPSARSGTRRRWVNRTWAHNYVAAYRRSFVPPLNSRSARALWFAGRPREGLLVSPCQLRHQQGLQLGRRLVPIAAPGHRPTASPPSTCPSAVPPPPWLVWTWRALSRLAGTGARSVRPLARTPGRRPLRCRRRNTTPLSR